MLPENGVWRFYDQRDQSIGIGWYEAGELRWELDGPPKPELEARLKRNLRVLPTDTLQPKIGPEREPFDPTNPDHAGFFFGLIRGIRLPSGVRVSVDYDDGGRFDRNYDRVALQPVH